MSGGYLAWGATPIDGPAARRIGWAQRAYALADIKAAGFKPTLLSPGGHHYRIKIKGQGWFDFWPSSGRWAQSPRPGGLPGVRGAGVEALISALQEARP